MGKNLQKFLVLFLIPALFLTIENGIKNTYKSSFQIEKSNLPDSNKVITDSNCSLREALTGIDIPVKIREMLTLVSVYYYSFDGRLHKGQLVININLAKDIQAIFEEIKADKFPVAKVIPIYKFDWDDMASMKDNNTSAFNYRIIKGTNKISKHAAGRAIDINPRLNPQIKNGVVTPQGSYYNTRKRGTISDSSFIVKSFLKRGWHWGGFWKHLKDYQHFEK